MLSEPEPTQAEPSSSVFGSATSQSGLHGPTLFHLSAQMNLLFSETRPEPEGKETEEIPKETDQIQTMDDYIMAYCPDGFED